MFAGGEALWGGSAWPDASGVHARTSALFALRARHLALLDSHSRAMERSRQLVEQSRALCASVDVRWPARPSVVAVPAWHRAAGTNPAAARVTCARTGCGRAAILQPWFVADMGGKRVVIGNTALRVCAEHRDDLRALFADATAAEELRAKLAAPARSRLQSVRVMFEVVG
jgi:hypothetical protein